VGKIINI